MSTVICDKCGKEYGIGASPWCRDGHAMGYGGFSAFTPIDDDMIDRNGPVHFGNWGEKLAYMSRNGIEPKDLSGIKPGRIYSR
jgi:hypothetical protein